MTAPAVQAPGGMMTAREFFEGVRHGRLIVQRCGGCGVLAVPPKAICAACESTVWERTALSGEGEVASYTVIRVPPARLASEAPYVIVIARMAEGVMLLGRLGDVPIDAVRVGLPVRFAAAAPTAEPVVVTFRPR